MSMTHDGQFGPQDAYIGGIIGQETIKAITGKFMPIKQVMYADCVEILPQEIFSEKLGEMIEEKKPEEKKS